MKQKDLITDIKRQYEFFTKVEQKVADYVLKNTTKVIYMSITDLADACKVGDTSIFRFCKDLGLNGYQEFKTLLSMRQGYELTDRLLAAEETLAGADTNNGLLNKVYNVNIAALAETLSLVNYEDIKRTVDYLIDCQEMLFFGVGSSLYSALEAMSKFMRITSKAHCYEDSHMQAMAASLAGPDTVAVIFSYSGSTKDILTYAALAKENNAKIIAITRYTKSPLTEFSDITIQCGSREEPLQGGAISTKISQLFIIDLLYTEYYNRNKELHHSNKEKTTSSVMERMI